jgi:hypothetical protein
VYIVFHIFVQNNSCIWPTCITSKRQAVPITSGDGISAASLNRTGYAVSAQRPNTVAAAGNTVLMPFSTVQFPNKPSKSRSSTASGRPVAALLCSLLFVRLMAVKVNGAIRTGRTEHASQMRKFGESLPTAVWSVHRNHRPTNEPCQVTNPYAALAITAREGAVRDPMLYARFHCLARSAGGERLIVGTARRLKLAIYPTPYKLQDHRGAGLKPARNPDVVNPRTCANRMGEGV